MDGMVISGYIIKVDEGCEVRKMYTLFVVVRPVVDILSRYIISVFINIGKD